ncbi:membrane protein FxsA [Paenibacillus sp. GYB004]|uniref:FxsA family protein n=1 Tax=Paenibacillus sp. GYB004 TaxID=2994393 RepID=UPI002F96148E
MGKVLLLVFIIIPALEIWAIIEVGQRIGGWQTFGLILLTGFAGAYLARKEGSKVWAQVQRQMSVGQMPGDAILDGVCVLVGGLLLLSPGFLTDIAGIILLIPFTRPIFRNMLSAWLRNKIANGQNYFFFRR